MGLRYDWEELTDIVYRRYSDPQFIFDMPLADGLEYLDYVCDKTTDELIFDRWVHGYQQITTFDEFKRSILPPPAKADKEILADVEHILSGFGGDK